MLTILLMMLFQFHIDPICLPLDYQNYLPSFSGLYLDKEILMINKALNIGDGKRLGIIGGSKISTKLKVLENLTEKLDILFVGGGMANTFLLAKGYKIGKSYVRKQCLKTAS